jgi:integration host factor subunit alpha
MYKSLVFGIAALHNRRLHASELAEARSAKDYQTKGVSGMSVSNEPSPWPLGFEIAELTSDNPSRTLTRSDIADAITKRTPKMSRREAARLLDCVLQEIADALSQRDECVKLHEFGTFFVREKAARRGRNPVTGETSATRGRKTLNFRPSTGLKDKVEKSEGRGRTLRS